MRLRYSRKRDLVCPESRVQPDNLWVRPCAWSFAGMRVTRASSADQRSHSRSPLEGQYLWKAAMMGHTEKTIGENLNRRRIAQRISQEKLARMVGISSAAYRRIEKGLGVVPVDTLQAIASALGLSLMDLVEEVPRLSAVRFRSRKRLKSREAFLVRVARWIRDFNYLEELLNDKIPDRFENLAGRLGETVPGPQRARTAAWEARRMAGLREGEPVLDICGLLESRGIKVCQVLDESEGFFGLAIGHQSGGPAVVVNTLDRFPVERWIFSACHELGHLLLHLRSFDVEQQEENQEEEKEADVFAAYFLMPDQAFLKYYHRLRGLGLVERVLKVKRFFGVSYKTVLMRLIEENLTDKTIWPRFNSQYRRSRRKRLPYKEEPEGVVPSRFAGGSHQEELSREPSELDPSDFQEDRLSGLVRQALEEERITLSRAAEILDLDMAGMKDLVRCWKGLDDKRPE